MDYVLGIDLGSGYSKAVVCGDGLLLSSAVIPSGGDYKNAATTVAQAAMAKAGLSRGEIRRTVATGYGAAMVDFADQSASDISCQAAGIYHLFPAVRTVIDVGAQFSKVMRLNDDGKVTNFVLNEKCAGGSGKFLQVIARILHITIDEIGPLSLTATAPVQFTTGCAVFAESEAVSRIAEGARPGDILAGVHKAMASKIATLVVRLGVAEGCALTGGGAKDIGLVKAIEAELGTSLSVPADPQITAALGAALSASA